MGPFHWSVWVTLTFTYLFGIFPLAFSDRHSLKHLLEKPGEMENMFWYMFGTFTNSLTFTGVDSWSGSEKVATRLLIGSYWLFTIIITSCYTGSIIAFVTLPMFPDTVDSVDQLISGYYRVGTLDRGGWEKWFVNSSDINTNRLLKNIELLPNIESGLLNTTRAFFWPYAFLGSRAQLEYIVQANFSTENANKRSALHISKECFVPFGVSFAIPRNAIYTSKINKAILRAQQSGLIKKLTNEVSWEMQRTSTGKLLQAETGKSLRIASVDERGLTLADTQGMFLLLGAGFLIAGGSLISEWMGGCCKKCKKPKQESRSSISSVGEKSFHIPTPKIRKRKKTEYDHINNESSVCSYVSDDNNSTIQKMHHRRASSISFMFSKKNENATPIRRYSYCVNGEHIPVYLNSDRKLSVHSNVIQIHNTITKELSMKTNSYIQNEVDENTWNEYKTDIEDVFGDKIVHDLM